MKDKEIAFLDHFKELRRRVIYSVIATLLSFIVGMIYADDIILYFKKIHAVEDWNVFSPFEAINIFIKVALLVSLLISFPIILYNIWAFVSPGLRSNERKLSFIYIPFATILLIIGLLFSYFVIFPLANYFTTMYVNMLELEQTYGVVNYFKYLLNIIIPASLLFELPIILMFLTNLRIITPVWLKKMRKISYVLLFFISSLITPPDLISAIIVTIPYILLFELSILLSDIIYRKINNISTSKDAGA